ncbi:MAG TPA: mechanosensitive ion channel domain-containing protein [Terracidiphilus sp.]|nr:mechanosensitive ion channel domain-containing protein [Terracidiphilus sp.]
MAHPSASSDSSHVGASGFSKARAGLLLLLVALLALCFGLFWITRDAAAHLSFLHNGAQRSASSLPVDTQPWQTAQTLASMAVTAEENEYARRAEHLADHAVDQAFAAALRQAQLDAQHRTLTGPALALQQKIAQLEKIRDQDQAAVDRLSARVSAAQQQQNPASAQAGSALQVAKAQLGLDNDELTDAQRDLQRASGDTTAQIQDELAAHEQSMKAYDSQVASGQIAVIAMTYNRTLAARVAAWFRQRQRAALLDQAQQQALADAKAITAQHNALEARANSAAVSAAAAGQPSAADRSSEIASLHDRSSERQILSIDDDRIQTLQQLAAVYGQWAAQVRLQHRIVAHLILSSLMVVLLILIGMLACDALIRHLMDRPSVDRRQMHTLRNILQLGVQVIGLMLILFVVFGAPRQTPTILGLTTAALTIALQDYIVAFLGWFTLMGKSGIHVGDWVEINNVSGEVADFRLMTTTLLEADQGLPTGRRITFMNSYAIRGQYFNFSTAGQWTWEEIVAAVPPAANLHELTQRLEQVVTEETGENLHRAREEWSRSSRTVGLRGFEPASVVNLRPSGSGIELHVRYITPAAARFELRNRLYQRIVELLHASPAAAQP